MRNVCYAEQQNPRMSDYLLGADQTTATSFLGLCEVCGGGEMSDHCRWIRCGHKRMGECYEALEAECDRLKKYIVSLEKERIEAKEEISQWKDGRHFERENIQAVLDENKQLRKTMDNHILVKNEAIEEVGRCHAELQRVRCPHGDGGYCQKDIDCLNSKIAQHERSKPTKDRDAWKAKAEKLAGIAKAYFHGHKGANKLLKAALDEYEKGV